MIFSNNYESSHCKENYYAVNIYPTILIISLNLADARIYILKCKYIGYAIYTSLLSVNKRFNINKITLTRMLKSSYCKTRNDLIFLLLKKSSKKVKVPINQNLFGTVGLSSNRRQ